MSMLYVSIVLTSISAHIQVESSRAAAKATEKAAALNAKEKQIQAKQVMEVASENARRKQEENRRQLAAVRAANAANGFQMEGTPLAVFGETALQLERDILDISFEAESQRRALLAGAQTDVWEGANQSAALQNQATASAISSAAGATGGYLSASGSVASSSSLGGTSRPSGSPKGFSK